MNDIPNLIEEIECAQEELEQKRKTVENLYKELGDRMRQARESRHVSLRHIASRLGICAPYLSDMELGRRRYALKFVNKVRIIIENHE